MADVNEQYYAYTLKQETKPAHIETEKVLVKRLKEMRTKEAYAGVLKMFYGFVRPLEQQINSYISELELADINERRKATRLQDDLIALGIDEKPDICKDLPTIHNTSHAFGALYVIEGSTLGGEIIVKMLKANSALEVPDAALSFFYGYKENNLQMWQKFQRSMEQHMKPANVQQVIKAANETFRFLKNWMIYQHETTSPY